MAIHRAWALLGEVLAASVDRAVERARARFADDLAYRVQFTDLSEEEQRALVDRLRESLDVEAMAVWGQGETAELAVQSRLRRSWQHVDEEYDGAERAAAFESEVNDALARVHDEGDALLAAIAGSPSGGRRAWTWPIDRRGELRDVIAAWREAAAERMQVPADTLVDPASVAAQPVFEMNELARALDAVGPWLREREAWARALTDVMPFLAAMRASA